MKLEICESPDNAEVSYSDELSLHELSAKTDKKMNNNLVICFNLISLNRFIQYQCAKIERISAYASINLIFI
ncbi:hypothetical protein KL86DYS1_11883 [uncultured Dysgonomonas sp.]|uniref:Uncharacterized protein n=1 Tax=uncultured Dysgonomonas sp. TaxID=206096 RepID=A0A212JD11_9BACT|nr:hypothetical protein KL86DYS1_11883 [uncultured Dysgonomonas sp.]